MKQFWKHILAAAMALVLLSCPALAEQPLDGGLSLGMLSSFFSDSDQTPAEITTAKPLSGNEGNLSLGGLSSFFGESDDAGNDAADEAPLTAEAITAIAANDLAALYLDDDGTALLQPMESVSGTVTVQFIIENGVVVAVAFVEEAEEVEEAAAAAPEQAPVQALVGEAKGHASMVKVTVTLNDDGSIATLTVDASGETPGIGTQCADDAFTKQFIGKKAPFAILTCGMSGTAGPSQTSIDAVGTATVTSWAVIEALNALLMPAQEPVKTVDKLPVQLPPVLLPTVQELPPTP